MLWPTHTSQKLLFSEYCSIFVLSCSFDFEMVLVRGGNYSIFIWLDRNFQMDYSFSHRNVSNNSFSYSVNA